MSMFQLQERWRAESNPQETFSHGSLAIGNVDNDPCDHDKLVTGSLHGVLRVYLSKNDAYSIDHLLLERNVGKPILQLAIVCNNASSNSRALAVLHPQSLSIYSVEAVRVNATANTTASHYKLTLQNEHVLGLDGMHFSAYSFVYGPFRKNDSGIDHLCVQSLDGRLQFIENNQFAFMQAANNHFLPNAMCYVSAIDAFILGTADLHIECHRYQTLASASLSLSLSLSLNQSLKNRIYADWRVNVGETVLEICFGQCFTHLDKASSTNLLILGEHTLFVLHVRGFMLFQRRLDFVPATLCVFPTESKKDHYLIVGHDKLWRIYNDETMIWSTKSQSVPCAVRVATIGVKGMLVCLDTDGQLAVYYLGTDPMPVTTNHSVEKELSYEEMDETHRKLLMEIRQWQSERKKEPIDCVRVGIQIPTETTENVLHGRISLSLNDIPCLTHIQLSIIPPIGVETNRRQFLVDELRRNGTPVVVSFELRAKSDSYFVDSELTVLIMYIDGTERPRVSQYSAVLPFSLFCRVVAPIKDSTYKLTIETDRQPLDLLDLFTELIRLAEFAPNSTNVLSFQYVNDSYATILVSKNAGRYRIQSNTFPALYLVVKELIVRLRKQFLERNETVKVEFSDALPLGDMFRAIHEHFDARNEELRVSTDLERRASQLRAIQRRLMCRYKDPSPKELQGLDLLFQANMEQLLSLSYLTREKQYEVIQAGNRLNCAVSLMLLLLQLRFQLDQRTMEYLSASFSTMNRENNEKYSDSAEKWEERTELALSDIIHSALTSEKQAQKSSLKTTVTELKLPSDLSKLERLIRTVIDRLSKGVRVGL